MWAETNQAIFFPEHEEVAVADHFIAIRRHCVPASIGKGTEAGEVFVLSSKRYFQQVGEKGAPQETAPR